ncbi:MAG: TonB-dependent receptor, partial [Betaproteobacteria bacterium]|nr:TonB-dependent receptor [Betaproteobacteria bacterium]
TFDNGDSTLNKETSNNFDLSLQKTSGLIQGRVNLFYNHINNYIFQQSRDSNGDGLADRVNDEEMLDINGSFLVQDFSQTRARFYGVEAEATVALIPDVLDLRIFTDIVYADLKNNGNIPRITPQRFGVDLDYRWNSWLANFNVTRVSRQNRVARLETETPGHTLMNAEIAHRFKRGPSLYHTLFLQGKNLLDSDIRVHTSFLKNTAPLPGRAVVVGIRGEF